MANISIIIPVFNASLFLDNCIRSLKKVLNDSRFEIIFVNDGSTDNTIDKLTELSKVYQNLKVIEQENSGPSKARENGFINSSGGYIAFMDSDDIVDDHYFLELNDIVTSDNSIDIIVTNYYEVYKNKKIVMNRDLSSHKIDYKYFYDNLLSITTNPINCVNMWGKLYKKTIVSVECFKTQFKLAEDLQFNENVLKNKDLNIYYSGSLFYHYLIRNSSLIRTKSNQIETINAEILFLNRNFNINLEASNKLINKIFLDYIRAYIYLYNTSRGELRKIEKKIFEIATQNVKIKPKFRVVFSFFKFFNYISFGLMAFIMRKILIVKNKRTKF